MITLWQSELTRAALPQAVLALLGAEPSHGYAMIEILHTGGFVRIKGGTLYPLLKRFEDQGLVEHSWKHDEPGPGRKVFALTELGRKELERSIAAWQQMNDTLAAIRATRRGTP